MPSGAAAAAGERRRVVAWLSLCAALALHVADEAFTDFLSVYNPAVQVIRSRVPALPLPTFEFRTWLSGLIVGIVVLLGLTPLVARGGRGVRWFATAFAGLMVLNGIGHMLGSVAMGRPMPGVYSSPFLLAAAIYALRVMPGPQDPTG